MSEHITVHDCSKIPLANDAVLKYSARFDNPMLKLQNGTLHVVDKDMRNIKKIHIPSVERTLGLFDANGNDFYFCCDQHNVVTAGRMTGDCRVKGDRLVMLAAAPFTCLHFDSASKHLFGSSLDAALHVYSIDDDKCKQTATLSSPAASITSVESYGFVAILTFDSHFYLFGVTSLKTIHTTEFGQKFKIAAHKGAHQFLAVNPSNRIIAISLPCCLKFFSLETFQILDSTETGFSKDPVVVCFVAEDVVIYSTPQSELPLCLYNFSSKAKSFLQLPFSCLISSLCLWGSVLLATADGRQLLRIPEIESFAAKENTPLPAAGHREVVRSPNAKRMALPILESESDFSGANDSVASAQKPPVPRSFHQIDQALSFDPKSIVVIRPSSESFYLMWNSVGTVGSYRSFDSRPVLKIQFHDATQHASILLDNSEGYNVADLSNSCVALLARPEDRSLFKLRCICFLLGKDTEWNRNFSSTDFIMDVACSSKLVCVGASCALHLFSVSGVQMCSLSVARMLISVAAHEETLLLLEYTTSTIDKHGRHHHLTCQHIHLKQLQPTTVSESEFVLPPERLVVWSGFTNDGRFSILDSDGNLHLAAPSGCGTRYLWGALSVHCTEDVNFRKTFVYDVDLQQTVCHLIVGSPDASSLPDPSSGSIHQVLTGRIEYRSLGKSVSALEVLENELVTASILDRPKALHQRDAVPSLRVVECLFKIFAVCCRSNDEVRAYEIASILRDPDLVEKCVQYASSLKFYPLIKHLNLLR